MKKLNKSYVRAHWKTLQHLPEPGEKWSVADVDELSGSQLGLTNNGVVIRHERSEYGQPCIYETREEAHEYIKECVDRYKECETA